MGFCRLLKIILSATALALLAAGIAAETYRSSASAAIQATATVVPSLGMLSPDDVLLVTTPGGDNRLGSYQPSIQPQSASGAEQLLMHYPSSGVLLSVGNVNGEVERLSLENAADYLAAGAPDNTTGPGAVLLDLERLCRPATGESGEIILTVIYTEN